MSRTERQPRSTIYSKLTRAVTELGVIQGLGLSALGITIILDSLVNIAPPEALPGGIVAGIMGLISLTAGLMLDELSKPKIKPQELQSKPRLEILNIKHRNSNLYSRLSNNYF